MTTHESLRSAGVRFLRDRGYRTDDRGATDDDPVLPGPDATSPFPGGDEARPTEVASAAEPLPGALCHRLASATAAGHDCLFVAPAWDGVAAAVADVLASPACVREENEDGSRAFYAEEDRVRLGERGFALVRSHDPALDWHEEPAPGPADDGRAGTDARDLVLTVDGDDVAVLDGVDALACPPADAFPLAYRRDPVDKRFHVTDRDGEHVGTYPSVAAMRRDGFAPVPSPFVPEHVFEVGSLRGRWAVLAVEDGTATLVAP